MKSFADMDQNIADSTENTVDEAALADIEGTSETGVATTSPSATALALGQVSGDIDARDITLPRLYLVQKVGELPEMFEHGSFVLNKEIQLVRLGEPLSVVVLAIDKYYEEKLEFDPDGPRPDRWSSAEEAINAGMSVAGPEPTAHTVADIKLLIKKPDEVNSPSFGFDLAGGQYAVALWTVRKSSYAAARRIFSAMALELSRTGLLSGNWNLFSKPEKFKTNTYYSPVMQLAGTHDAEFVEQVRNLF